jgi:hypothetical protein
MAMADAYTTRRALDAAQSNPPAGQYYIAVNGLRYLSPGPLHEINPLLGRNPSAARLYLQLNAQDVLADFLILRSMKAWPTAVFGSTVTAHTYGIVDNLRNMSQFSLPPPALSRPCTGACQAVRLPVR